MYINTQMYSRNWVRCASIVVKCWRLFKLHFYSVWCHSESDQMELIDKWQIPPPGLCHRPPFAPVQRPLASHASERHQTFPVWCELKQIYLVVIEKNMFIDTFSLFLGVFFDIPTFPRVCVLPRPCVSSFTVHAWNSCLKRDDSAPSVTVSTFVVIG